jgi:replicative DNA helicase
MANFRKIALARILNTSNEEVLLNIKEDYFFDIKSKKLYQWTMGHYKKHHKIPSAEVLGATISAQLTSKGDVYVAYLESLSNLEVADITPKEIIEGLADEYKVHYVDNTIQQLVEAAEEKDLDRVTQLTEDISKSLTLDANVLPVPIAELEITPDSVKTVEAFLPTMGDKGLAFSGVSLVSAASGGGKSIFALNQAVHSYQQGANVLYLNIEINSQEQLLRTVSHVGKVDFSSIYNKNLPPKELERLNTIKDTCFSMPNKFNMVNAPLDADTLINLILAEVNSGLDLVVLDYIQLVENGGYLKSWEFLQSLVKRLHRVALQHKIVILTPIQINASEVDVDANTIDITTRGSRELEFTSTVWIHIHQEPEEREENAARIFTVKARNAQKYTYVVETYFNIMTFKDTGIVL